jgi:Crp-like helix-turn-helix protein
LLFFTQQAEAQMLGIRRASVAVAAGVLQKAGLIRSARGEVTILKRNALEDLACECYGIIKWRVGEKTFGYGARWFTICPGTLGSLGSSNMMVSA